MQVQRCRYWQWGQDTYSEHLLPGSNADEKMAATPLRLLHKGRLLTPRLLKHISPDQNVARSNLQKQCGSVCMSQCNESSSFRTSNTVLVSNRLTYRQISTTAKYEQKPGIISRIQTSLGLTGRMKYKKSELKRSAMRSYMCCTDIINYKDFFTVFGLPDTFNSWFRITELHIWLVMVKLAKQGKEGHFMRNALVEYMWMDTEARAKRLGQEAGMTSRKDGLKKFSEQFYCSVYNYDEGLLSSDMVLAGAIWRSFFEAECDGPEKIEKMIEYMRKQIHHLEELDGNAILQSGLLSFLPLDRDTHDVEQMKEKMRIICMKS